MEFIKKGIIVTIIIQTFSVILFAQQINTVDTVIFTLNSAIIKANEKSLAIFKVKNMYLANYWEFHTYMAQKLPSINFNTLSYYNRAFVQRYNSETNQDVYREQQNLNVIGNLSLSQQIGATGGSVFIDSELGRLQNFGTLKSIQFSAIPFRIGYKQSLFGYNSLKWENKIEPMKFEKAKKDYLTRREAISQNIVDIYFSLVLAQSNLEMAKLNQIYADTLFNIGQKRFEIATVSKADLLTLKIDKMNAELYVATADKDLKQAIFSFSSFLGLDEKKIVKLVIPEEMPLVNIDLDKILTKAKENNPELLGMQQQIIEANRNVEKTKIESRFQADLLASFGLNQQDSIFYGAFRNPLNQQIVSLSISIPIIDWGVAKGKHKMAEKNREVVFSEVKQAELDFSKKVLIAASNFQMQYKVVQNALETRNIAKEAYRLYFERFLSGNIDVNTISIVQKRQDDAKNNYIQALKNYWTYYFEIRRLTLFDFEKNSSLKENFEKL